MLRTHYCTHRRDLGTAIVCLDQLSKKEGSPPSVMMSSRKMEWKYSPVLSKEQSKMIIGKFGSFAARKAARFCLQTSEQHGGASKLSRQRHALFEKG